MSSYRQIIYHIIFGTKNRELALAESHCNDLYKFICCVVEKRNCKIYRINGVEDHLHILSDLHPTIALADFVKEIKTSSSIWLKNNSNFPRFYGWAEGYAALTYSIRDKEMIINYIKNQKIHHQTESYISELKQILTENQIEYNDNFI